MNCDISAQKKLGADCVVMQIGRFKVQNIPPKPCNSDDAERVGAEEKLYDIFSGYEKQ